MIKYNLNWKNDKTLFQIIVNYLKTTMRDIANFKWKFCYDTDIKMEDFIRKRIENISSESLNIIFSFLKEKLKENITMNIQLL
jgi:hypothetical protein